MRAVSGLRDEELAGWVALARLVLGREIQLQAPPNLTPGVLELLLHCDYLVSVDDATMAFPEVTLPVVPGMEGCHWPFRKTDVAGWSKLFEILLNGSPVKANDAVGWLIDYSAPLENALKKAWLLATGGEHGIDRRTLNASALTGVADALDAAAIDAAPSKDTARKAIVDTVVAACESSLVDALEVQSTHSAGFMASDACREGSIGAAYTKMMKV